MKTEDELKQMYINNVCKTWDEQTKEKYIDQVEEDFKTWYKGYLFAIREVANDVLPILEFTKGKLNSEAGIFQLSVTKLIDELHTQAGRV